MKSILALFTFSSFLFSQSLSIVSELDTTDGFIGDVITWTIEIEGQTKQQIQFPELKTINDTITIRNQSLVHENGKLTGIQFELMAWDTGHFVLPTYTVNVLNDSGVVQFSLETNQVGFSINSILTESNSTDFRPIKGPVPVKGVFPTRYVLLSILLLLLIAGMIWTWRQRQEPIIQKVDYTVIESPRERANRRLNELEMSGSTKEYYADLSHISREYIESKYFIRALEMTTEEIGEHKKVFPMDESLVLDWIQFLSEADMVKYAKAIPTPEKKRVDKDFLINLISNI